MRESEKGIASVDNVKMEENQNVNEFKLDDDKKLGSKENKKVKSVLWAKIVIIVLVISISILGLFKFADYLNKPKTLFYNAVENMYSSFNSVMESLQNDRLYKLLSASGVEINSDIKVDAQHLYGEYKGLENVLNVLDFNTKTEIDKNQNYMNFELNMSKDNVTRANVNLIDDDFTYLKMSNFYDNFIKLDLYEVNIEAVDPYSNITLIEILKHELLDFLNDERFSFEEVTIAVNGTPVNCNKSTYSLNGKEILSLLSNMINAVKNNVNALDYIAKLYGVKVNQIENKLNDLVESLNINVDTIYEISAYTKVSNDEGVRLEITFDKEKDEIDDKVLIAFNRDISYVGMEYSFNNIVESFELKGSLDASFVMIIKNEKNTINISGNNKNDGLSGTIKSADNSSKRTNLDGTFSYTLKANSDNDYSLSYNVDYSITESNETANVKLNASSKIKTNVKVDKKTVKNAVDKDEYEKELGSKLNDNIINYIKNIDISDVNQDVLNDINNSETQE